MKLMFAICLTVSTLSASTHTSGQNYPAKSVRVIVPYAPAGGTDIIVRALAQKMSESTGQQFVVENRAGANGIIGTDIVAKSPPDGYTLITTTNALLINHWLYSKIPFHPERDLAPITIAGIGYNLLAIHNSLPVKSVKEFIALAKARPGQLVMAASGAGQPSHMAGELFKQMAKIDFIIVQYKGTGASIADLAGGHVMLTFGGAAGLQPLVRAGKLRALAVSGTKRLVNMPDVPTVSETLPGFDVSIWYALLAPARTSREVIAKLHAETVKALSHEDMKLRLAAQGYDVSGIAPEQFAEVIRTDLVRWEKVVRDGNIRVE